MVKEGTTLKRVLRFCQVGLLFLSYVATNAATQPTESQPGANHVSGSDDVRQIEAEGFWAAVQFAMPNQPDDFDNNYSTGLGGTIGFDHRLARGLRFLLKLSYIGLPASGKSDDYETVRVLIAGMDLKWTPAQARSSLKPYVLGGVGIALLYQKSADDPTFNSGEGYAEPWKLDNTTTFCYSLAIGLERRLTSKASVFVQVGSTIIPKINDNSTAESPMRLNNLSLGLQLATERRRRSKVNEHLRKKPDSRWDIDSRSTVNIYGGAGVCAESSSDKNLGVGVSIGLGRDLTTLAEAVLKSTVVSIHGKSPVPALGLYLKMNLRRRHHKSWVYLLAGGGGLVTTTWRTTTTYYLGTGLGGVLNTGDTRKLNLELRWLVPTSGGSRTSPRVLATIGVAI